MNVLCVIGVLALVVAGSGLLAWAFCAPATRLDHPVGDDRKRGGS